MSLVSFTEYHDKIQETKVLDHASFSRMIFSKAEETGEGIIETIVQYCEEHYMDVSEVIPNIDQTLKEAIEAEAISTKRVKSTITKLI